MSSTIVQCTCPPGYIGSGIGPNGCIYSSTAANPCSSNPCRNGNCSISSNGGYICTCNPRYTGANCDVIGRDPCTPNPCQNGGVCTNFAFITYRCRCKQGFTGALCDIEEEGTSHET